jgi:hypothetical protein
MPQAQREAVAVATKGDGSPDWEALQTTYAAALKTRQEKLVADARSVLRAMEGWGSIRDQADWDKAVEDADRGLDRGLFLLERLGAERYLDPQLMAVLLVLRRRLVDETGAHTALEFMLIDSDVMAYYHQLRISGWIGDFSALLENEFFGNESLTAKLKGYYGSDNVRGRARHRWDGRPASDRLIPASAAPPHAQTRWLSALGRAHTDCRLTPQMGWPRDRLAPRARRR